MRRELCTVFLTLSLVTLANCQGSLLEMSQDLWSRLLAGGLTKVGKLDPLRVPVVKVDQSQGDTSYRMILKNVEISGLNDSTLESIHIARGRLKSNLSELEAGYVSYSDLRDLDSIRYRFHTLVKEPKQQNESFEAIVSATNSENKFKTEDTSMRFRDSRLERLRQYDPFLLKIQGAEMKNYSEETVKKEEKSQNQMSGYGSFNMGGARVMAKTGIARAPENTNYPADVQLIYALSAMNSETNSRNTERGQDAPDCPGGCQRERGSYAHVAAGRQQARRGDDYEVRQEDAQYSASENVETRVRSQGIFPGAAARGRGSQGESHMEKQPGYIDIVYADGKNNGSVKRFGNVRMESKENARVYGLEDVMKGVLQNRRFISYNFTDGQPLSKRNEEFMAALGAKDLKDLIRYANDYQEKQGYFEEGMQLVYHYGGMDAKNAGEKTVLGMRHKRAHREDKAEDDVMHVILKIRVPLLRVKSEYQLMGKVGKEFLRGNGQFDGNFTELVGDFTIELKKATDGSMIVRAARSKLTAKSQNVDLQGMDEKGPVSSILSNGLMAAEAVAAMLADDLATKALNDKTADAMIYRMYKNLPAN